MVELSGLVELTGADCTDKKCMLKLKLEISFLKCCSDVSYGFCFVRSMTLHCFFDRRGTRDLPHMHAHLKRMNSSCQPEDQTPPPALVIRIDPFNKKSKEKRIKIKRILHTVSR